MQGPDQPAYRRYTSRSEIERCLAELQGLIEGVEVDAKVNDAELAALRRWSEHHAEDVSRGSALRDVARRVLQAIADERITDEERADIVWKCSQARTDGAYFALATRDMQRLHGVLGGVAADGVVTAAELRGLRTWMDDVAHLRGVWPYDEVDSIITAVLRDGEVDDAERRFVLAFCADFLHATPAGWVVEPATEDLIRHGVCATQPSIEFPDRTFCFTGESSYGSRDRVAAAALGLGAIHLPRVTQQLDYLVVCQEGSPAWAFSCYGRKVEQAVKFRRAGHRVSIVHETDFWDALEDAGGCRP